MPDTGKRLYFICSSPITARDRLRFGQRQLTEAGFTVRFVDLATPSSSHASAGLQTPASEDTLYFADTRQALAFLKTRHEDAHYILSIPLTYRSKPFLQAVHASNVPYILFGQRALHTKITPSLRFRLQKLHDWTLRSLANTLRTSLSCRNFSMRPPAYYCWMGGAHGYSDKVQQYSQRQVIPSHSLDYNIYLDVRAKTTHEQNIAVFLDEYLPFHSDYSVSSARPFTTAEEYYPLLRRYFDAIEKDNPGLQVVIAAHPRSNYKPFDAYFGGRPLVMNETADLVRSSRFVMLHMSTSITFPILFDKPLVFLTTDVLNKTREGAWIRHLASYFDAQPVNLSAPVFNTAVPRLTQVRRYRSYKDDFIKVAGTEDTNSWTLLARHLLNPPG